ncbi:pyruvate dehydrogenase (acetyl-transferring) kinase, mitochondrial-like [Ctenocephalides felis]|uniref:pyruvate dehydrogenase (acetyl-transferring) kinase, mitochondrial-like n=1 Tax=Ctenocephalides felis TaxID=7515 RepID=UPI000E6E58F0|nr:pyruvate dehydrogenase (acetyl-transferring) kinase, mitochondrial-like [Ctenocephalides felis]
MKEIALLPERLLSMPSVDLVSAWYARSFQDVINLKKQDINEETLDSFCTVLSTIRDRHADVVQTMAQGVLELKDRTDAIDPPVELSIQYFLDRLYMSRISIRMLINQHTLLFGGGRREGRHIGCIDPVCDPASVVRDAYENARFLCDQYYLAAPDLKLVVHNGWSIIAIIHPIIYPSDV